jgi:hypothetical protein
MRFMVSSVREPPSRRGSKQFEERKQLRAMPGVEPADGRWDLSMSRAPKRSAFVLCISRHFAPAPLGADSASRTAAAR